MSAGGTAADGAGPPDDTTQPRLPDPDPNLVAVSAPAQADGRQAEAASSPVLPRVEARAPAPMVSHNPVAGAATWYRTDQQRYKSVYRRANPWYRRLARGLVGLSVVAVVAAGLYFGAQLVQDYLQRDKLPSPGQETPEIASTSFLVTSSSPAPELDGTVTLDTGTLAFEFVGGPAGPQAGVEIVSPDGGQIYVRRNSGAWRVAPDADPDVSALTRALPYLRNVDNPDDVLENRLRHGYIDLVDETTEGVEPDNRERYEMNFDTQAYSTDYPLQWQEYQSSVIPGISTAGALPVTMWLDDANVVVRLRDDQTNWAWERLTYSDQRFQPIDPSGAVVPETPVTTPPSAPPSTVPAG